MIQRESKRSKLQCLLCQGMITLIKDDEDRFLIHMKTQHDAYFNLEFLRAACRMDEDEKTAVIDVMKNKGEEAIEDIEELEEDIVELEEISEHIETNKEYKIREVQVRLPTLKLKSFDYSSKDHATTGSEDATMKYSDNGDINNFQLILLYKLNTVKWGDLHIHGATCTYMGRLAHTTNSSLI